MYVRRTPWVKKHAIKLLSIYLPICQVLTDFYNFFHFKLCRKLAITWLLNFPPRLNCSVTPPCEKFWQSYKCNNIVPLVIINVRNVLLWLECRHEDVFAAGRSRSQRRFAPVQSSPNLNQALLQIIDISHVGLVETLLLHRPHILYWTGLRSGLFGGHKSGEINAGVSRSSLFRKLSLSATPVHCLAGR